MAAAASFTCAMHARPHPDGSPKHERVGIFWLGLSGMASKPPGAAATYRVGGRHVQLPAMGHKQKQRGSTSLVAVCDLVAEPSDGQTSTNTNASQRRGSPHTPGPLRRWKHGHAPFSPSLVSHTRAGTQQAALPRYTTKQHSHVRRDGLPDESDGQGAHHAVGCKQAQQ